MHEIRNTCVLTDKGTCFSNAMIPSIRPSLGRDHTIYIKGYVQSDTAGEGPRRRAFCCCYEESQEISKRGGERCYDTK